MEGINMDITIAMFFGFLKENIWLGLLSIFLFFLWKGGPQVIDILKSYFNTKQQELINIKTSIERGDERLSTAVNKISDAIFSFEKALLGVKSDLQDDIKDSKHSIRSELLITREELKKEIRDNKIENLFVQQKRDSRASYPGDP